MRQIAQKCVHFVVYIRGRVRKGARTYRKKKIGQFHANTPFPMPPSPNFLRTRGPRLVQAAWMEVKQQELSLQDLFPVFARV